jgi:hypothetical protein
MLSCFLQNSVPELVSLSHFLKSDTDSVKVKIFLEEAKNAQRGSRGIILIFLLTAALDEGGWLTPRLGRFTPGKGTLNPQYRRLITT